MCLLINAVASSHPQLDQWVRTGLPNLPDLEAQVDAVVRFSGAERARVEHAFKPEPFSPIVGLARELRNKARAHPTTVLRFDIDTSIAARFEANPTDLTALKVLQAAFLFGIADRLKSPERIVIAEEIETEVFGASLQPISASGMSGISDRIFPGRPLAQIDLQNAAQSLDVGEPHLWAVLMVEARSSGFDENRRPKILYERHIFSKLTGGVFDGQSISSPVPGGYNDAPQYDRLKAAFQLAPLKALASCSWGLGQVMGNNHRLVGHETVEGFVSAMIDGEADQLAAMIAFIKGKGLGDALRNQRWADFAEVYNGPEFREKKYDTKLAAAFQDARSGPVPDIDLRRDQVYLTYLGLKPGPIDGRDGRKTQDAVRRFQQSHAGDGLQVTGERDAATIEHLAAQVTRMVQQQRGDLI
jgi:hypothetical protein